MSPVRLAVVSETCLPDINGVATSLQQLLQALSPAHFRIQLIRLTPPAGWTATFEEVACPGLALPGYAGVRMGLPARRRIRRAWGQFRPDLVYIATEGPLGWSALQEAQQQGLPVISAFHTNFHSYSGYYGFGWVQQRILAALRRFHNRTAMTLVPSQEVADSLIRHGFERVRVLPHGVDSQRFHPQWRSPLLREQWQVAADDPVLLYVGRLAAEKNLQAAISAWQTARQQYPRLRLVLVGDGPLSARLRREHPQLILAGPRTGADLARHYASADAFVFPSQTETFGLVTLEAMASGLPVIAYPMAAARVFVEPGRSGELAADRSGAALTDATLRWLQQRSDRQGQNARKQAEQVGWEAVALQFEQHCRQLLMSAPQLSGPWQPEHS